MSVAMNAINTSSVLASCFGAISSSYSFTASSKIFLLLSTVAGVQMFLRWLSMCPFAVNLDGSKCLATLLLLMPGHFIK